MSGEAVKSEDLELFHYGVKGMKWGVIRKSDSSGGSSKKSERKSRNQEIKDARQRQSDRSKEIQEKFKERRSTKYGSSQRAKIDRLIDRLDDEFVNNDDFDKSFEATTGEKWLNGGMMAVGLAAVAGSYAISKRG